MLTINRKVLSDPYYFLAFGFGSGLVPRAPGTWGSLVGLLLFILPFRVFGFNEAYLIAIIAIFFFAGAYVCDRVARELGEVDPGGIVLDEIVGIWLVLVALPDGWFWLLIAFALFRLLDIWKPWPIRWIDRNVKGGVGIMLDDVAAGVIAWALIQVANRVLLA